MADSLGLEEIKRLARLFAQTWAEARDDPLSAGLKYLQGASTAAGEAIEPVGKMHPGLGMVSASLKGFGNAEPASESVMPPDNLPSMRADSAAQQMGYEQGIPTPSSGAQNAARQVFTRITDPAVLAEYRRLRAGGMAVEDIWRKIGVAQWKPGEYFGEIPGQLVGKRPLPRGSFERIGRAFEWPELMNEINAHQVTGDPAIQNRLFFRLPTDEGGVDYVRHISGRPQMKSLEIGTNQESTFAHEMNHFLEALQTGTIPGGTVEVSWKELMQSDPVFASVATTHGMDTLEKALNRVQSGARPLSPNEAKAYRFLAESAFQHYLKHPGETRARIAGVRDVQLSEAERRGSYPFAIESHPSGGRAFVFDDARGIKRAERGVDMTSDVMRPSRQFARGTLVNTKSELDPTEQFFTKPKGVRDKLEDLLADYVAEQASR